MGSGSTIVYAVDRLGEGNITFDCTTQDNTPSLQEDLKLCSSCDTEQSFFSVLTTQANS